jgi:hypothetical protein
VSYLSVVAGDNPLHWWRLLDPGGQIAHDIGSAPTHLLSVAAPRFGYGGPSSDGGSWFNPSGEEVSSHDMLTSLTSPMSLEAWIWLAGIPAANGFAVAWDQNGPANAALIALAAGTMAFNIGGSSNVSVATFTAQTWRHLVGTFDNANNRLYVDGVLRGTVALAGAVTVHKLIGIGAGPPTSATSLQGFFSDVAIYGYTLTAAQVLNHYNAANQVGQAPVFIQPFGNAGVPSTGAPATGLQDILNSVRKTY